MKIERPKDKVREVYSKCISKVNDKKLKKMLELCQEELIDDEKLYIQKGEKNRLCDFPKKNVVNSLIDIYEMKKVYTYRMVNLKQPGREYYNKLLNSVPICPFCGVRDVATLDHYLPKSKYATTVVTPMNLVPACRDCNSNKDICDVTNEKEEVWHPYFDDYEDIRWLYCNLLEAEPLTVSFYVDTSICNITTHDKNKICNSFLIFKLKTLYEIHALKELKDIEYYMKILRERVGVSGVKEHLHYMYESSQKNGKNSWKTALYETLKTNEWYISDYLALKSVC